MSKIIYKSGNPFIEIEGKLYPPFAFRSFRPTPANVSLAYRNGIRLFQMIVAGFKNMLGCPYSLYGDVWQGKKNYHFGAFDKQMELFLRHAPEGRFCVMIPLDTRDWWLKEHPDSNSSYYSLGKAGVDEAWIADASEYLCDFITYAEAKYGDKIYAYSFSAGGATEWFAMDLGDKTERKEAAFRAYCQSETATIPSYEELNAGEGTFRAPHSDGFDYLTFSSNLTCDLVCRFAKAAQEVLHHKKLIGVFYGYINVTNPKDQNLWLTNAYERAWQSPDIDMLFSPAAYGENRLLSGFSSYQVCVDSVALSGKLYVHEIDHRTHLANYPLEAGNFLTDCYETEEETICVLRRELCNALVKKAALWWFDFFGGYFASPAYEAELQKQTALYRRLLELEWEEPAEIAVFIDPMSFLCVKESHPIHKDCVKHCITALHQCGAPFRIFNLADLTKINFESYKLFIFLNAFQIPEAVKNTLSGLKDAYCCYLYAPDYAGGNSLDPARICEITGMQIKPFESQRAQQIDYSRELFGFSVAVSPQFEVCDAGAETLAYDTEGRAAFCRKGNVFYCASGNIPYRAFRDMAKIAGVHLYTEKGYGLCVTTRFIAAYTMEEGTKELFLPYDCKAEELLEGGSYQTENRVLRFEAKPGHPRLFLLDLTEIALS